jgi:hypothetical protein
MLPCKPPELLISIQVPLLIEIPAGNKLFKSVVVVSPSLQIELLVDTHY